MIQEKPKMKKTLALSMFALSLIALSLNGSSASAQACDNADDLAAIENATDTLRNIGGACGSTPECFRFVLLENDPVRFALCVTECVQAEVGISTECATCFGDVAGCGVENGCLGCENDSCSASCLGCLNGGACLDALDACTGIPAEEC